MQWARGNEKARGGEGQERRRSEIYRIESERDARATRKRLGGKQITREESLEEADSTTFASFTIDSSTLRMAFRSRSSRRGTNATRSPPLNFQDSFKIYIL
eukprot:GHVU01029568.1.p3 GENE.GHVU01029568.1~~GHVU01029568.1.p3  ORF type:complete len:101 (-),score=15.76 GHVU01029568.1:830-1132(-)